METITDQLPPHDAKAEGFLLACAIHRPSILLGLTDELFYLNESKEALEGMLRLKSDGKSSVNVPEQFEHDLMRSLPQNVFSHVNNALNDLPSPSGWSYWLELVSEYAQARRLMSLRLDLNSAAENLAKGDKSGIQSISKKIQEVSGLGSLIADVSANVAQLDNEAGKQMEDMWERGNILIGLGTGFQNLNRFTNGLQEQKFYVVAGRPGKGKSSFIAQIAQRVAVEKIRTLFLSMEMPAKEIYLRLVSQLSHVDLKKIQERTMTQADFDNVSRARLVLRKMPLTISDKALTLSKIIDASEKAIRDGAKLIVVDYIQKVAMPDYRENRSIVIGYITGALKEMAMQHNVTVLAAAQVNRESEKEEREPILSDLRESGCIENDADWVAFLHDKNQGTTDLIIRKNRSGPEGKIPYKFQGEIYRFDEL